MATVQGAKFLLRFDDICPTMNWKVWRQIELLLRERGLKPIMAVVPDNQDTKLIVESARADFWDVVRGWQGWGWTIGLHGYQHRYVTKEAGITRYKKDSEFAGLPESQQEDKLRKGVEIFEREGIKPAVWVAPSHSFDKTTVSLLPRFGIDIISDGYAYSPYVEDRMIWVPVQHSGFRQRQSGVWTICFHCNGLSQTGITSFRNELDKFKDSISSFELELKNVSERRRDLRDASLAAYILTRKSLYSLKLKWKHQ